MSSRLTIKRWAVDFIYRAGIHRLFVPVFGGVGCILCFHRVLPPGDCSFPSPHVVDTRFFEEILRALRARGYDLVTMSEAYRRLVERDFATRFACLTFDDGYRDNHDHAWPICQRYGAPITVYLTSGFIDREVPVWWVALELLVRQAIFDQLRISGQRNTAIRCPQQRRNPWRLGRSRSMFVGLDPESRSVLAKILSSSGEVNFAALSDDVMLTWETIRAMAKSGSVEFGAHTVNHPYLSSEDEDGVRAEINDGRRRLEDEIGRPVNHFAYPFGKRVHASRREFNLVRESGFATAVTGRAGCLMADHREHLLCLPRIAVDGRLPTPAALEAALSGTLAAITGRFRRVATD